MIGSAPKTIWSIGGVYEIENDFRTRLPNPHFQKKETFDD